MYATVKMEVERKSNALVLPSDAVSTEKAGTFVYLVTNGAVHKTPVKTGFRDGTNVELTDGVPAGAVVARLGKQALTDGQAVRTVAP